jgi:hypothetical protein
MQLAEKLDWKGLNRYSTWSHKNTSLFSLHYLREVLNYVWLYQFNERKEHSPEESTSWNPLYMYTHIRGTRAVFRNWPPQQGSHKSSPSEG